MLEDRRPGLAAAAAVAFAVLSAGCAGDSGFEPVRLQVRLSAEPASIAVDGTSTLTAQVTNNQSQPASGIPIEWSTNLASLRAGGGATNANGRTTATLSGQGEPGVALITATIVGLGERAQVEVRIGPN